jgi:hypothetical protein
VRAPVAPRDRGTAAPSTTRMKSLSGYSVYDGWQVQGWPRFVVRRGQVVLADGAFYEVPFAVGQPQRPCLGDAQVQERDGFQVAAECGAARLAVVRAQRSLCLLEDAVLSERTWFTSHQL